MPNPEYKKYVPVKKEDERQNFRKNIDKYRIYNTEKSSLEKLFTFVRGTSTLGDEKRQEEFLKLRKEHNDIQPLCSPETYDAFFKDIIPGFRTITDPKEIEERQEAHDLAWDTFQEYVQKVLPINKPYEYPEETDRFARSVLFALPQAEDKQKLYELVSQKGNPDAGDSKMQEEYATLVKHSIDYMLKMEGQIERINKLDDKEFLKKIMPYMGLVIHMSAADDSLKIKGVSETYDKDTQDRIKNLDSIGTRTMTRLQRMLATHYPAMTFKDEAEMTFTELNLSKQAIDAIDEKVKNGIVGIDILSADVPWTTGIIAKGALNVNPIVYGKLNEVLGMNVEQDDSLCDFIDIDGNIIKGKEELGIKLDRGELVYAQSRKNLEKNMHNSKLTPIYCGGSIIDNKVLSGDEALKQAALDNKGKTYSVEDELNKYDQAHPKPTISWWNKMVATVVSAVTFNNFETAAWSNYMEKTDAWENGRNAAKAEFTKKKETLEKLKSGKMSKKVEDKLKELRNENEIEYENQLKNKEKDIINKEKEIINHFVTDESKLNVNASIERMKAAQIKGDAQELAKGLAEVIAANAIQEKLLEHVGNKKFANEFADITNSFNKEKEVSKLMQSKEFFEFFKQYDYDKVKNINGASDIKDVYKDYLKAVKTVQEEAPQLDNKPQLENQKPEEQVNLV